MVCISNCDKITPGHAARRHAPQHPDGVRVRRADGGGQSRRADGEAAGSPVKLDLIDPMIASADPVGVRRAAGRARGGRLPDLRLVLGHVHRELDELPDRGDRPGAARQRHHAGHPHRPAGAVRAGRAAGGRAGPALLRATTTSRCCRCPIATRDAFENAMALDVAMGGSTNTILHLLAAAHEARVGFGLKEIDELSRRVPCLCKVAPEQRATTWRTCTGPAASRPSWASWTGPACSTRACTRCTAPRCGPSSTSGTSARDAVVARGARAVPRRAGRGPHHPSRISQDARWAALDDGPGGGLHPGPAARLQRRRRPGRAATATWRPRGRS